MQKGQIVYVNSWEPDFLGVYEGVVMDQEMIKDQEMIEVKIYLGEFGTSLSLSLPSFQIHDTIENAVLAFEMQANAVLDQLEMIRGEMGEENFSAAIATIANARYDNHSKLINARLMKILYEEPTAA